MTTPISCPDGHTFDVDTVSKQTTVNGLTVHTPSAEVDAPQGHFCPTCDRLFVRDDQGTFWRGDTSKVATRP